ncbi:MAG: hypothetical protein IPO65_15730 [Saprospiraceae bacterium]|nr:hypothetical protein [Saprospiraceae bacterium]
MISILKSASTQLQRHLPSHFLKPWLLPEIPSSTWNGSISRIAIAMPPFLMPFFKTDICGGITIPMKITVEGAKTFPVQRKIEFTMKSSTLDDQAHDKLSTNYIFDNRFLEKFDLPFMYFVQQPNYIQWPVVIWTVQIKAVVKVIKTIAKFDCGWPRSVRWM